MNPQIIHTLKYETGSGGCAALLCIYKIKSKLPRFSYHDCRWKQRSGSFFKPTEVQHPLRHNNSAAGCLAPPCGRCADMQQYSMTVTKTVDRGADATPVCIRKSLLLATCKIDTGRHQDEDCCQLLSGIQHSECECDSRFALKKKDHRVFLYLSSLSAADGGNYTCECSYERGTHVVQLRITVGYGKDSASFTFKFMAIVVLITISAATTFISAAGIVCGHFLRRNHHRQNTSGAPQPARSEALQSLEQDDTYTSLQRSDNDVYHSVSISRPRHNTDFRSACTDTAAVYTNSQEALGKEHDFDSGHAVYDTIQN